MKLYDAVVVAVSLLVIAAMSAAYGCRTAPVWEGAEPGCLERANAACIAAMSEGRPAGVVICTLPWTTDRHAVTWIETNGRRLYWDAAFRRYLSRSSLGRIHSETRGPSLGAFDLCPMPLGAAK